MKASPESIKNTAVNTVFYAREDNSSVYSTKYVLSYGRTHIYYILQFYYYYNFISFFFPTGAVRL